MKLSRGPIGSELSGRYCLGEIIFQLFMMIAIAVVAGHPWQCLDLANFGPGIFFGTPS